MQLCFLYSNIADYCYRKFKSYFDFNLLFLTTYFNKELPEITRNSKLYKIRSFAPIQEDNLLKIGSEPKLLAKPNEVKSG